MPACLSKFVLSVCLLILSGLLQFPLSAPLHHAFIHGGDCCFTVELRETGDMTENCGVFWEFMLRKGKS